MKIVQILQEVKGNYKKRSVVLINVLVLKFLQNKEFVQRVLNIKEIVEMEEHVHLKNAVILNS